MVRRLDDRSPPAYPTYRTERDTAGVRTSIFRCRYLQLARYDQLHPDRIQGLGKVLSGRPELQAAWRMVLRLYGIYLAETEEEANQAPGALIDLYQDHPLLELEKLCETLLEWGDEIFAFHHCDRITNGRIEGTNNKLGVLRRVATDSPTPTTSPLEHSSKPPLCHEHITEHRRARLHSPRGTV